MSSPQQVRDITLESLLSQKKSAIVKKWFNAILETYPAETAKFLSSQKNQFANPVGSTVSHGIENIFQELLQAQGIDPEKVSPFLDKIIRIRAIQDFSPSQAVAFVFFLKKVIREVLAFDIQKNQLSEELLALEARIDDLALLSFDIYMKCREKLYELRANDVINGTYLLLKRAKLMCETPEPGSDHKDDHINSLT
ncbi:MAG: RsbRD N-terminal domain-containing protein [Deltaproteobacteria bacterium]|nr:RsbRD N-terminal domain-containing protein [Deltaproteobacteria bacterium]